MYDKFTLLTCRKTQMATALSPTVHIILFLKEILFESSVFDEKKKRCGKNLNSAEDFAAAFLSVCVCVTCAGRYIDPTA